MTRTRRACVTAISVTVALVSVVAMSAPPTAAQTRPSDDVRVAAAAAGPFVTLLFSRTEISAADNCVRNDAGIVRLETVVAPYLTARGMTATGTLTTALTQENALTCTHWNSSLSASWARATALAQQHGWRYVSHTATYPVSLAGLTPAQSQAETCGSAAAIDSHGLTGGHGMIAYPGAQPLPITLQTDYASKCFAWGRKYANKGITLAGAGAVSPFWQITTVPNGGPCNVATASCYTVVATGSQRYVLPEELRHDRASPQARTVVHLPVLHPGDRQEPCLHHVTHSLGLHVRQRADALDQRQRALLLSGLAVRDRRPLPPSQAWSSPTR